MNNPKFTFGEKVLITILSLVLGVMIIDFICSMTFTELLSFIPFVMAIAAVIIYYIEDDEEDDCDPFK